MALYAVGDIHGCLTALKTLFDQLELKEDDQVVFLGDYVDRGPDAKGVLDFLIENKKRHQFHFIKGNHEIMMFNARNGQEDLRYWLYFGGDAVLDSYGVKDDPDWEEVIGTEHWWFLERCLPTLTIGEYIFVHAGLEAGFDLEDQDEDTLFWKKFVVPEKYSNEHTVICGHTSRKNGEIANFGHTICIDTYAYGGQWLSCLNVETKEYIQANEVGEVRTGTLSIVNTN